MWPCVGLLVSASSRRLNGSWNVGRLGPGPSPAADPVTDAAEDSAEMDVSGEVDELADLSVAPASFSSSPRAPNDRRRGKASSAPSPNPVGEARKLALVVVAELSPEPKSFWLVLMISLRVCALLQDVSRRCEVDALLLGEFDSAKWFR